MKLTEKSKRHRNL